MKTLFSKHLKPVSLLCLAVWVMGSRATAQPLIQTQPRDPALVSLGATVQLRVSSTSTNPPITYRWWFKEAALDPRTNPSAASNLLLLTNVSMANAGPYFVVVSDTGSSSTSRIATVTVDTTFTKITAGPGEPKSFTDWGVTPSWWDYDNDGFLDLFIANGFFDRSRNRLYHNNRDGSFTRIDNVISTTLGNHVGGVAADYDNDGDEDLFISDFVSQAQKFYRNDGAGSFTRLTEQEIGSALGDLDPTVEAAWVDYDRDGFLDLFRNNGMPSPAKSKLYRNNTDGTFTRMTTNEVGQILNDYLVTSGCAWVDYDNDGWQDLLTLAWAGRHLLYHNDGGIFRKVTGASYSITQHSGPTGGGGWGDFDNDGFVDLFIAGLSGPHMLYHNLAGLNFTNVAASAGIPSTHLNTQDASWADYDNDGFLDLYVTADPPGPSLLLRNNGNGTFTPVDVGSPIHDSTSYRFGIGWADYDNDGFLDLAVACYDGPNLLYHNNGNSNRWLKVKLTGTLSNRSAIGAKIRVQASIRGRQTMQTREITGNSHWTGGTPGLLAHFGLGDATNVDLVRIEWPSGVVQELHDVAANQSMKVTEHQAGASLAPRLTAFRASSGMTQLTITGQSNLLYLVEASWDLVKWTKIAVRTNLTGSVDFTDQAAANYPQRFYRGFAP